MPFCKSNWQSYTFYVRAKFVFFYKSSFYWHLYRRIYLLTLLSFKCGMDGLAKGSWEFYRIWSYLNQLFQSCNIWWGREKGILLHFFSGFFSLPTLPWPTNQSDWVKMLEFYAKSSEVCYMAPKSLLNQTESSGCWKAYLESDLTEFWNDQSPAYSWGKQPILMFCCSSISICFSHRDYRAQLGVEQRVYSGRDGEDDLSKAHRGSESKRDLYLNLLSIHYWENIYSVVKSPNQKSNCTKS